MKRVLLDECVPRKLGSYLTPHAVSTVTRCGWSGIKNGALLGLASQGFDVFLTVDKALPQQQQIAKLEIAVVLVRAKSNDIDDLTPLVPDILDAIDNAPMGSCIIVSAP